MHMMMELDMGAPQTSFAWVLAGLRLRNLQGAERPVKSSEHGGHDVRRPHDASGGGEG